MNLVLQQLSPDLKGPARSKLLAPEAAVSLHVLEKDTDGKLIYVKLWNDATGTLMDRRTRVGNHLPGYDPHNYGLALNLDVPQILDQMKISYEDLLYVMKRRGWFCHRRDGSPDSPGSGHFNFIGDNNPDEYMKHATFDPVSWDTPIETRIHERYSSDFQLSPAQVQSALQQLGFFHGAANGEFDGYTREAILAFQRAWDLAESGTWNGALQRTLAFVSATISLVNG
jgi:hypothetical protein